MGVHRLHRSSGRRLGWLLLVVVALAILMACSLAFGVRVVAWSDLTAALMGSVEGADQAAVALRIPRTAAAVLVGASLGVAGATMQAVTRNPLADPGILGVLSGAALAVVIGLVFLGLSHPVAEMGLAVAGAATAAVFVYAVGSLGRGGATPLKLALSGAATTAAASSLVSAILLPRVQVMDSFRFWQIGGVGGITGDRLAFALPGVLVGLALCLGCAKGLNSLALGDDVATGLGEDVARTRLLASLGAVILCGLATAVAGPIAFVGLVVPHACRLVTGTDHRWLVPFSALTGAGVLLAADTLGRVVARPNEIAVGILTPLIGAPFFIWIVRRQKVREL